jgi:hypothetical protein
MRFASREGQLLFVTPPAQLSTAIVDEILAGLVQQLTRGEPYGLVFDLSVSGIPNAMQRQRLANHMTDHAEAIRHTVRGLAVVAPHPLVRGIVTALFWVAAPPIAHNLFTSRAEATAWAKDRL